MLLHVAVSRKQIVAFRMQTLLQNFMNSIWESTKSSEMIDTKEILLNQLAGRSEFFSKK